MTPSSSCGRNSEPRNGPSANAATTVSKETATALHGLTTTTPRNRSYRRRSHASTGFSQLLAPCRKRYVASTGISVKASSMEPSSAKETVKAMGVNSRRSTRSRVNKGI